MFNVHFSHGYRNKINKRWLLWDERIRLNKDFLHRILSRRFSNFSFFRSDKWSIEDPKSLISFPVSKRSMILSDIMTISQSAQFKFNAFKKLCSPLSLSLLSPFHNIKDFLCGRHLCGLWKIIIIQKSKQYLCIIKSISNKQEAENIWFLNMHRIFEHPTSQKRCHTPNKVTAVNHSFKSDVWHDHHLQSHPYTWFTGLLPACRIIFSTSSAYSGVPCDCIIMQYSIQKRQPTNIAKIRSTKKKKSKISPDFKRSIFWPVFLFILFWLFFFSFFDQKQ